MNDEIKTKVQEEVTKMLQEALGTEISPENFEFVELTNSLTGESAGCKVKFDANGVTHYVMCDEEGELDGDIVTNVLSEAQDEDQVEEKAEMSEQSMEVEESESDMETEDEVNKADDIMNKMSALIDEKMSEMKSYVDKQTNRMGEAESIDKSNADVEKSANPESDKSDKEQKEKVQADEASSDTEESNNEEKETDQEAVVEKSYTLTNEYGLSDEELKQYFPSIYDRS